MLQSLLGMPIRKVACLSFCCLLSVAALGYFRRSRFGRGPRSCGEEGGAHIQTGHSRTVRASSDICVQITQNGEGSAGFSLLQTLVPFVPAVPLLGKTRRWCKGLNDAICTSVAQGSASGRASPPGYWRCVGVP